MQFKNNQFKLNEAEAYALGLEDNRAFHAEDAIFLSALVDLAINDVVTADIAVFDALRDEANDIPYAFKSFSYEPDNSATAPVWRVAMCVGYCVEESE